MILVHDALVEAGREDLIGIGPKCLIKSKEQRYMDAHGLGYKGKKHGKNSAERKKIRCRFRKIKGWKRKQKL